MKFKKFNKNPALKKVGDCTVRAIATALNQTWQHTYIELAMQGLLIFDMPSSNEVWEGYLKEKGFKRQIINKPFDYTIIDFCYDFNVGTYIIATGTHVVCVENGYYYDTWDSGDERPIYFWKIRG